jgi:hypothetical protein
MPVLITDVKPSGPLQPTPEEKKSKLAIANFII